LGLALLGCAALVLGIVLSRRVKKD